MSGDLSTPVQSPGSDVSPRTQPASKGADYFNPMKKLHGSSSSGSESKAAGQTEAGAPVHMVDAKCKDKEIDNISEASATSPGETMPSPGNSEPPSRKASVSSVTFRRPKNPSLPQGEKKGLHDGRRIRAASPPHRK